MKSARNMEKRIIGKILRPITLSSKIPSTKLIENKSVGGGAARVFQSWNGRSDEMNSEYRFAHTVPQTDAGDALDPRNWGYRSVYPSSVSHSAVSTVSYYNGDSGVSYDEDYDEYNLHMSPSQVQNRDEWKLGKTVEGMESLIDDSVEKDHWRLLLHEIEMPRSPSSEDGSVEKR